MKFKNSITIKAGDKARALIRKNGFSKDLIDVVAGAAGGPKWLILRNLDRAIFGQWLKDRKKPLPLIGSSIATFRFACICNKDSEESFKRFENAYIKQSYEDNRTSSFISSETSKIIDTFLSNGTRDVLNHPFYRLNIMTAECKWPVSSFNKITQGFGLSIAFVLNLLNRDFLKTLFKRALFYDKRLYPDFFNSDQFGIEKIALTENNLKPALLASGSIPFVMEGVRIDSKVYRDGGVIDYNMDLKYENTDGLILFPHYSNRIVPGWLDKKLKYRKPFKETIDKMVLISPSEKFLDTLPNKKIPDRNDFMDFSDKDRMNIWNKVIDMSRVMEDDFNLVSTNNNLFSEIVKPL